MTRLPALLLLATACTGNPYKDDSSGDSGTDSPVDSEPAAPALLGSWLSEGENISPLFQSSFFNYVSIQAVFNADLSYEVVATDAEGASTTLTGSFVVDTSTTPAGIVLTQATPSAVTAEGIWQVEGTLMTYEVVQTDPNPYGFVAPTPETGFGSTSGPGLNPGDNVQKYERVE